MRYFSVNVRKEMTEFEFMPTLQLYLLEENDKLRPMVIVVPGGGYSTVCIKQDGDKTALQYNASGFHAAVLDYCVEPHCFPEPQMDLALGIKLIRENAEEWGIQKDMIAVCGFSAGGHLCANLSTLWNNKRLFSLSEIQSGIYKPNATILCSAILTTKLLHGKSFLIDHIGGEHSETLELVSCNKQVNESTPPTFLYNTFEDKLTNVENVLYYTESLKKYGIPFEIHIFPKDHGAPWCDDVIWSKPAREREYNYLKLSIDWLKELFGLL